MHMALDEVLLQRVIAGSRRPTVRFWDWIEPTLVIGSHQSVLNEGDVVPAQARGFTITRRISGGGTVLFQPHPPNPYLPLLPASIGAGLSFRHSHAALAALAVPSVS